MDEFLSASDVVGIVMWWTPLPRRKFFHTYAECSLLGVLYHQFDKNEHSVFADTYNCLE